MFVCGHYGAHVKDATNIEDMEKRRGRARDFFVAAKALGLESRVGEKREDIGRECLRTLIHMIGVEENSRTKSLGRLECSRKVRVRLEAGGLRTGLHKL